MLVTVLAYILMLLVLNSIIKIYRFKNRQKEWDGVKANLKAFAQYIGPDEMKDLYINYIDEIK